MDTTKELAKKNLFVETILEESSMWLLSMIRMD